MQSCRQQQEPTEAIQVRLNAAPERRRNLRPSGRGGCQIITVLLIHVLMVDWWRSSHLSLAQLHSQLSGDYFYHVRTVLPED